MTAPYTHNALCSLAKRGVPALRTQWSSTKLVHPRVLSWPSKPIQRSDGVLTSKVCLMELPPDREWAKIFRELVELTSSCGLLLIEQTEERVRSLLETPKGTRCWDLPIKNCRGTQTLGRVVVTSNEELIGALWRPRG